MKMKNMYVRKFSKNIANWKKSKKQFYDTVWPYLFKYQNQYKSKLFVSI